MLINKVRVEGRVRDRPVFLCSFAFGRENVATVRRQIIWRSIWAGLVEHRPRLGVDVKRRGCGVASVDVRWSVA